MKKTYIKPTIYVETFELSQHIASCGSRGDNGVVIKNQLINNGCNVSGKDWAGIDMTGSFYIDIAGTNCGSEYESYCYTNAVSIDTNPSLFSS